ncbi:NACHT domain-containing protein [Cellulomonas xiejunii]|uniref:NACHT domain-containing protein n=1 Tax=Cellulomonas xiejunii TaxID=2968083 RepID=A0ABY5KPB9_9CELL|nr:NACHT domain-containing protein [Cellulomonas xiejunii]MCC2322289.1 NACHT domain-containing protein [Cellulomonas xiejunii]UUI72342.1 NACHT domain-containing protein [Cellulomonas xiejunii]
MDPTVLLLAAGVAKFGIRVAAIARAAVDPLSGATDVLSSGADAVGDATGLVGQRPRGSAPDPVATRIATELDRRLAGVADVTRRADLESAARDVGALFVTLADDDAALVAAVTLGAPGEFERFVDRRGGGQVRFYSSMAARPLVDACIGAACAYLTSAAPRLPGFSRAAMIELLRRTQVIVEIEERSRQAHAELGVLRSAVERLDDVAPVDEVIDYLESRRADWDRSTWRADGLPPSRLEQSLRGVEQGGDVVMSDADALDGHQTVVVLGGPGSGKTWLAHRYARQAATRALDGIRAGKSLAEIELPLVTSWAVWQEAEGDPASSLISAAFSASHGYRSFGGDGSVARMERTYARAQRVLVIVDSLDEAPHVAGQRARLDGLLGLRSWRAVVTSRHGAWDATFRGTSPGLVRPRVVELRDIRYPDDVEPFIEAWFSSDRQRAEGLVRGIRASPELQRASVVPLVTTFYCLIAESEAGELPERRRALYDRVARRLLRGDWSGQTESDVHACVQLLATWAGTAVAGMPSGLGTWKDAFVEPFRPPPQLARAMDNVTPRQSDDREGRVTRQFRHRTLLEHFVAEHIASLPGAEAAQNLVPHLWFDPEWSVSLPAAVAAHNARSRGELLDRILDRVGPPRSTPAHRAAYDVFEHQLLAIAAESDPGDWVPEHQALLNDCRIRHAVVAPRAMARTRHWTGSNDEVCVRIVAALATLKQDRQALIELARALIATATTPEARNRATTALLDAWDIGGVSTLGMEWTLVQLATTPESRAATRSALLQGMVAHPEIVDDLALLLVELEDTPSTRLAATAALTTAICRPHPWAMQRQPRVLVELATTSGSREAAATSIMRVLGTADPVDVVPLTEALLALASTPESRGAARAAIVQAVHAHDPRCVSELARALVMLDGAPSARALAAASVMKAMDTAAPFEVGRLARTLVRLDDSATARSRAVAAVLRAVQDSGLDRERRAVLIEVATSPETRRAAVAAIGLLARTAYPRVTSEIVRALLELASTPEARMHVCETIAQALDDPHDADLTVPLAEALVALDPTPEGRSLAVTALRRARPRQRSLVIRWARTLVEIDASAEARSVARAGVSSAMDPSYRLEISSLPGLASLLTELDESPASSMLASATLSDALDECDPRDAAQVATTLVRLDASAAALTVATAALVRELRNTSNPREAEALADALIGVVDTPESRQAVQISLAALVRERPSCSPAVLRVMVASLRRTCSTDDWLNWMREG